MDKELEIIIGMLRDDLAEFKQEVKSEITEVKADIKTLLRFKWQIVGSASLVSGIISFIFSMLSKS
jgi:hypothetical protein